MVYPTKKVIKIPLTVVTLTNAPNSLRGDLTKWMQEIATGVYVGNFNVKVREKLRSRILENIGDGQATISYAYRNEIGYKFDTINTQREYLDFEGLPLVLIRKEEHSNEVKDYRKGFSKAAKFRKSKIFSQKELKKAHRDYIVIDIETDGLDYKKNNIIEVGAVKVLDSKNEYFQALIKTGKKIPEQITDLTKIDEKLLNNEGREIEEVIDDFLNFLERLPIVGYNLNFDIMFINKVLRSLNKNHLLNKRYDLLTYVKKEKKFLSSYTLSNILKEYGIQKNQPHRALEDAKLTYELSRQVNKFLIDIENE